MDQLKWNAYKQTEEGKYLTNLFNHDYTMMYDEIFSLYADEGEEKELRAKNRLLQLFVLNFIGQFGDEFEIEAKEDYERLIDNLEVRGATCDSHGNLYFKGDRSLRIKKGEHAKLVENIDVFSTFLYTQYGFFVPILPNGSFDLVQENCKALGLEFPPLPEGDDPRAVLMWYYDFCLACEKFKEEYRLSEKSFCACLYGLADVLVEEANKK